MTESGADFSKLSFIAVRCQPASRADRMSAGHRIGLALPTQSERLMTTNRTSAKRRLAATR